MLNAISKIFEKVVTKKLNDYATKYISNEQHGFLKSRSTTSNLAVFTDYLTKAMDNEEQTDAFYLDLSKAFDRVDHDLLLWKLSFYRLSCNFLAWLKSYLSNRKNKVYIDGIYSEIFKPTSGVPQGSILGPLLFILFFDDICKELKSSNILLYADDAKIYKKITCFQDCEDLQKDLIRIQAWCELWKLRLNMSKCNVITSH